MLVSAPFIFSACEKGNKEKAENLCPVVAADAVPQAVKDSFALRYPGTIVTSWFNKDNVAFCAFFITSANVETLAEFGNSGSFILEQIETNQDGQHEDSTATTGGKTSSGCECDIHNEGD